MQRPIRVVCITCVHGWLVPTQCTVQPGTQQQQPAGSSTALLLSHRPDRRQVVVCCRAARSRHMPGLSGGPVAWPFPLAHRPDGANSAVPASASVRRSPKRARWERDGMAMPCHSNGAGERQGLIPPGLGLAARRIRLPGSGSHGPTTSTLPDVCLFGVCARGGPGRRFAVAPRVLGWWWDWECHTGGLVVEA